MDDNSHYDLPWNDEVAHRRELYALLGAIEKALSVIAWTQAALLGLAVAYTWKHF